MILLKNNQTKYITIIFSILLFAYPFYPYAMISIVFLLFVLSIAVLNVETIKKNISDKRRIKIFLLLSSWLILLSFTVFYSEDKDSALKLLLRYLNALVIIFIFIFSIGEDILKKKYFFYLAFILSNFFFTLFIYYKAITVIETTCFPQIYFRSIIDKIVFTFSKPNHIIFSCFENEYKHSFFIHRVYNSMSFLFSSILIIEVLFESKFQKIIKILLVFIGVWFVFLIYYQFSVVNVFLTLVLLPIFVFIKIKTKKVKKRNLFYMIGVFVFTLFVLYNLSSNSFNTDSKQLTQAINMVKKFISGVAEGQVDDRYEINEANKELFHKKPFFGYGIGDVQNELNNYYNVNKEKSDVYKRAYADNINSHNYYYFILLSGGIFLFLIYFISQMIIMKLSLTQKDWLYFIFLILFSANLIFENMLSRIHGVFFFSIFNSLFLSQYLNKIEIVKKDIRQ